MGQQSDCALTWDVLKKFVKGARVFGKGRGLQSAATRYCRRRTKDDLDSNEHAFRLFINS